LILYDGRILTLIRNELRLPLLMPYFYASTNIHVVNKVVSLYICNHVNLYDGRKLALIRNELHLPLLMPYFYASTNIHIVNKVVSLYICNHV
jgi:hypothetical protein